MPCSWFKRLNIVNLVNLPQVNLLMLIIFFVKLAKKIQTTHGRAEDYG